MKFFVVIVSFLMFCILPIIATYYYVNSFAAPQFISRVGFTIYSDRDASSGEILSSIINFGKVSSTDIDILHEFLTSEGIVRRLVNEINLIEIYSKAPDDFIFRYRGDNSIEDIFVNYQRKVEVTYDPNQQLIEISSKAFSPSDAKAITTAILKISANMLNELSKLAEDQSLIKAKEVLEKSLMDLKSARTAITSFQSEHTIFDPSNTVAVQSTLISSLETRLSETLIERDLLLLSTTNTDARIIRLNDEIQIIRERLLFEKMSMNTVGNDNLSFVELNQKFQNLSIDLEYAQAKYVAALSTYDDLNANASRDKKYLLPYLHPTLPEKSTYPDNQIVITIGILLLLSWAIIIIMILGFLDRRI